MWKHCPKIKWGLGEHNHCLNFCMRWDWTGGNVNTITIQEQTNMHILALSKFSLEWKDFYLLGSWRFWNHLPNGNSEAQDWTCVVLELDSYMERVTVCVFLLQHVIPGLWLGWSSQDAFLRKLFHCDLLFNTQRSLKFVSENMTQQTYNILPLRHSIVDVIRR